MVNPFVPVINSLLPEPHASLLSGILFGVKASMPKSLYNDLITTGTLHIIALSGMNISILANLFARITLFMGRRISSIITIIFIIFFTLFVGFSASVVRAAIMASISLIAVYFGRQNWSLLSLFLAAGIMLLFNFNLLKDLSFELSFLATFGLILAGGKGECQKEKSLTEQSIHYLKENFRLTLAAQLFTVPLIFFIFRRISLISPLANVLIEWAIQPVMIVGFITVILGVLYYPLGIIPSWFAWVLLSYVIKVIEGLAKLPGASVNL